MDKKDVLFGVAVAIFALSYAFQFWESSISSVLMIICAFIFGYVKAKNEV